MSEPEEAEISEYDTVNQKSWQGPKSNSNESVRKPKIMKKKKNQIWAKIREKTQLWLHVSESRGSQTKRNLHIWKKSWKKRFKPNSTSYVWKPQFLERFKFDSIWVSLEEAKLKRLKSDSSWLSVYKPKMSKNTQLTKNHEINTFWKK